MRAKPVAIVLAATLAWAGRAQADEAPGSSEIAAARALGVEGIRLAEAHDCEQAIDRLARAERLYHAPTTLVRLAECQLEIGRVVDGTENLQRVLREPLPPRPPAAFVFARARAERALSAALPKIAKLRVTLTGAGSKTLVLLDGEPVMAALLDVDRPTDPGEHTLEASAPGFAKTQTSFTLAPGEHRTVPLTLTRDSAEATPVPASAASAPAAATAAAPEPSARSSTAGVVMVGFGAAGLVAGGVFAGMYFSRKADLEAQCPGGTCPPGASVSEDGVTTLRAASLGAVVVGATSVAIGIVLLATGGGSPLASTRLGVVRF